MHHEEDGIYAFCHRQHDILIFHLSDFSIFLTLKHLFTLTIDAFFPVFTNRILSSCFHCIVVCS